MASGELTFIPN